jgi:hypothetical protein
MSGRAPIGRAIAREQLHLAVELLRVASATSESYGVARRVVGNVVVGQDDDLLNLEQRNRTSASRSRVPRTSIAGRAASATLDHLFATRQLQ